MIYICTFFTHFCKTVTGTTNNNNNENKLACIHFRVFGFSGNWRGGAWADGLCHIDNTGPAITVRSGQTGKMEPFTVPKVGVYRFNTIDAKC